MACNRDLPVLSMQFNHVKYLHIVKQSPECLHAAKLQPCACSTIFLLFSPRPSHPHNHIWLLSLLLQPFSVNLMCTHAELVFLEQAGFIWHNICKVHSQWNRNLHKVDHQAFLSYFLYSIPTSLTVTDAALHKAWPRVGVQEKYLVCLAVSINISLVTILQHIPKS